MIAGDCDGEMYSGIFCVAAICMHTIGVVGKDKVVEVLLPVWELDSLSSDTEAFGEWEAKGNDPQEDILSKAESTRTITGLIVDVARDK